MDIETREAGTEVLKSDIITKERNLAGRLEKGAGLAAMALFIAGSAMAEKAVEQKILTEPEEIKTKLLEVVKTNEAKPILLKQMELIKKPFAVVKLEEGEIKIETPKVEVKKAEALKTEPEIELTKKEDIEKKSFPG